MRAAPAVGKADVEKEEMLDIVTKSTQVCTCRSVGFVRAKLNSSFHLYYIMWELIVLNNFYFFWDHNHPVKILFVPCSLAIIRQAFLLVHWSCEHMWSVLLCHEFNLYKLKNLYVFDCRHFAKSTWPDWRRPGRTSSAASPISAPRSSPRPHLSAGKQDLIWEYVLARNCEGCWLVEGELRTPRRTDSSHVWTWRTT